MLVSFLSLIVTLMSFISQLVIARLFGAGQVMDVYLISSSFPFLILGLMTGAISYSIVPALVSSRVTTPEKSARFAGAILISFAVLAIGIWLVGYWFSPQVVRVFAPTLSKDFQSEANQIARISWVTVGCALLLSCLTAIHNSARRFVLPVLVNLLPYMCIIVVSLLWARQIGTLALAWGMLAGIALAILFLSAKIRREISLKLSVRSIYHDVSPILITLPLVLLSISCTQVFGTSDAFWASRLAPGSVSYLGYGQRIIIALGSLVIQGPAVVIVPYLTEAVAMGRFSYFRHMTARALRMTITIAAPLVAMVIVLRIPIISLLFQRGAFDVQATNGIAFILPGLLLGMVAMVSVVILLRALHAVRDINGAAMIGGVGMLLYFGLSGVFSQFFGLLGISLAYTITWWLLLGLCVFRIWRGRTKEVIVAANLKFIVVLLIAVTACSLPVWLLWSLLSPSFAELSFISSGMVLAALVGVGSVSFIAVAGGLFRMPEVIVLVQYFRPMWKSKSQPGG